MINRLSLATGVESKARTFSVVSHLCEMLFTGQSRGKDYYFRVRASGANGPSGWSDLATTMVVRVCPLAQGVAAGMSLLLTPPILV